MNRRQAVSNAPQGDVAAVSDVLGALMMVGITVMAAVGFGLLIFAFDGPPDTQHSRMAVTMLPGTGGWATGDEQVRVAHLRGEPLRAADARITITPPGGVATTLSGATQLGGAFADGELSIGETWVHTVDAALNDLYDVSVAAGTGSGSQLVAATRIVAGSQGGGALCLGDTQAPTGSFAQSPADVDSLTAGPVTVTLTVSDNCSGVDEASVPTLFWCVAVACTVPTSYSSIVMADTGTRTWAANIPSHTWFTEAMAGKSLRYYATTMADLNGNVGQTGVQTDLVNLVVNYVYVASASADTGAVSDFTNAQQGSAGDGALADLVEGGVSAPGGSAGPTNFAGTTATTGGALNPTRVLASDDSRAEFDDSGDFIEVSGFDLPANAATVSSVSLGVEGRRATGGNNDPQLRLDYKLGPSGTYVLGSQQTISGTTDADFTQSVAAGLSVAQVESMVVRVFYQTDTNRNPLVDHVFLRVTYVVATETQYRMDIDLEWDGVVPGASNTLELRYRVTGDTYLVQAWNFVTLSWRTCAGSLTSATLATYTCALVANEIDAGDVIVRVTDATPTSTTQGHLYLDHARLAIA